MTATRVDLPFRLDLCLVTLVTAALALAPGAETPSVAMPDPSPEQLSEPELETQSMIDSCADPEVTSVVVRGRITTLEPGLLATFRIQLADVPSRYEASSDHDGAFEVRIPVTDLGGADLCHLPMRGSRRGVEFAGAHMQIHYRLYFEK